MTFIFNVSDMDTVLVELNGVCVRIEKNSIVPVDSIAANLNTDYNFVTMMADRDNGANLLLIEDNDPIFKRDWVKDAQYDILQTAYQ